MALARDGSGLRRGKAGGRRGNAADVKTGQKRRVARVRLPFAALRGVVASKRPGRSAECSRADEVPYDRNCPVAKRPVG